MARTIARAENWENVFQAFQNINFTAFDYEAVKKSLIDYLKLYHSEAFSDIIESSELIMLVEVFAYIAEEFAYRLDLNAHENFITVAQRKESVLRLAKLLSYNASRNIPARGLVKIVSISSSEKVFDSRGNDLSNRIINWNDPNNINWKEQFLLVMNRVLNQNFGSVTPSDRVQVQDVVFERYSLDNSILENNVIRYGINVSGNSYPMELVSSQLNEFGPYEQRPEKDIAMNVLYLSDGLGDSSENTGFFVLTKQGQMQRITADFDGATPNQTFDITVNDINETDIWLNNIDPTTGAVIDTSIVGSEFKSGEWIRVDIANSQNITFNTNPNRNKYELETLDNDNVRIIFGDGNFANIPSGRFEMWYRVSANTNTIIPISAIQDIGANFDYLDGQNRQQTFSFSFSLVDPIDNAASSEDIEHIRRIAPAVYYTQDRMVNGRDYNEFPLQDNTILKLRSINRTFAGDSKYIFWHDPQNYYENVKLFGDDLVVYFRSESTTATIPGDLLPAEDGGANTQLIDALIFNYIQPVLSTNDFFINAVLNGVNPFNVRKAFNPQELIAFQTAILNAIFNSPQTLYFVYDNPNDLWSVTTTEPDDWWISLTSAIDRSWILTYQIKKLVVHSDETKFWINNNDEKIITYDTFNTNLDQIVILSANVSAGGLPLSDNFLLNVVKSDIIDAGVDKGTYSIHDLLCVPADMTGDGIPDYITLNYIISDGTMSVSVPPTYVYFNRECTDGACPWVFVPATPQVVVSWQDDQNLGAGLWKRELGREKINFLWLHRTPRYHLIDPSATNIIDMFIVTRGYYTLLSQWLNGQLENRPTAPTSFDLRSSYNYLLDNKMISDTAILHPGKIKIVFGDKAIPELQGSFKVVRSDNSSLTNNEIKNTIVNAIISFFDINDWEFGETFYFTELASYIHSKLPVDISSVVLVPKFANNVFGDLFQVFVQEDEIIQPSITVSDIQIVDSLSPTVLKQFL